MVQVFWKPAKEVKEPAGGRKFSLSPSQASWQMQPWRFRQAKTLSIGRFPPLCFALETATRRAQRCSRVDACADPEADVSNLCGMEFLSGSTREGAESAEEAYIPSKALPLRRNLGPRREFRSLEVWDPSSTRVLRAKDCVCCSRFFPTHGAHMCPITQR